MKNFTLAAALAGATALVAGSASALTVTVDLFAGDFISEGATAEAGMNRVTDTNGVVTDPNSNNVVEYEFLIQEDLRTSNVVLTGSGTEADLDNIMITYDDSMGNSFTITDFGVIDFGVFDGAPLTFSAGDTFTIAFSETSTLDDSISLGLSFETAVIPLPAAGGLLGMALLGAGMVSRRRKKAD